MLFDDYQREAAKTLNLGENLALIRATLELAGETGEVVEVVKKLWRNKGLTHGHDVVGEDESALIKELGDVIWSIAAICSIIGVSMAHVAQVNNEKTADRLQREVVKSTGNSR